MAPQAIFSNNLVLSPSRTNNASRSKHYKFSPSKNATLFVRDRSNHCLKTITNDCSRRASQRWKTPVISPRSRRSPNSLHRNDYSYRTNNVALATFSVSLWPRSFVTFFCPKSLKFIIYKTYTHAVGRYLFRPSPTRNSVHKLKNPPYYYPV